MNTFFSVKIDRAIMASLMLVIVLLFSGCTTIGEKFPVQDVARIEIGKTTQKQVVEMFGKPWRTGMESGQKTWTYGNYYYALFQEKQATDLVIRFDQNNVVASYTFSTTEHKE